MCVFLSGGDDDVVVESELLYLSSPVDLLYGPAPSCLPSPQLHPRHSEPHPHADLIHFERSPPPHCTGQYPPPPPCLVLCLFEKLRPESV